ncbi:MAG TPA: sulfotransferase [Chitinophagales bacterium]|nr:sulfotransferase [Chitinophagales bacterium]
MALQVIGTGMGRTGTMSLKVALEQLGFGKCYHMFELFEHPEDITYFQKAERGEPVDWNKLFEGYHSAVDMPVNIHYRQLMALYPEAKMIHTMRDAEAWYASAIETIFWATKPSVGRMLNLMVRMPFSPVLRKRFPVLQYDGRMVDKEFGKNLHDKAEVIRRYNAYNDDVLKTIPKERLLLYDVKSGWEPLCAFLNVPVPAVPFPKSNTREQFMDQVRKISTGVKELV